MANGAGRPLPRVFSFGPFRFLPEQHLLLEGDSPVKIGARALEILLALVERPGELVAKQELLSRAWPGGLVDEGNLKVSVASLRRAFRDTPGRARYIATVSGRGYRFVSRVDHREVPASATQARAHLGRHNLPLAVTKLIGRQEATRDVWRRSQDCPFLTISGSGGIGKTSVALAVAEIAAATYEHGAWLADLASVADPALVPGTIAAAVGLTVHSEDTTAALVTFLRDKRLMLVLDNCEHVIGAAAEVAERLVATTPGVHLIATSREPLGTEAEVVYRLAPLDVPPGSADLTAADAMTFSAVELFVERAAKGGHDFRLTDANAPIIRDICRTLDGIALAIELAATRAPGLGVEALRAALTNRFGLLNHGTLKAPARQRTLYATLDWSYQLLTESERIVLERLSLFAGSFDLEACVAVAASDILDRYGVIDALGNLFAKSLVSMSTGSVTPYRLFEMTRTFARERLAERAGFDRCAMRHAEYFHSQLCHAETELRTTTGTDWLHRCGHQIDDIRAAVKWALSADQSLPIGISLVVEAIPLWTYMSLLEECRESVEYVLSTPACQSRMTDRDRMRLETGLGIALLYTRGPDPRAEDALLEAERLAERLDDSVYLTRILWESAFYQHYLGHRRSTLGLIARLERAAEASNNVAAARGGRRLAAIVLHCMGHHDVARKRLVRMIDDDAAQEDGSRLARYQPYHRIPALGGLTYVLFVQGFADQARQDSESAVREAMARGDAISLGTALALSAIPIALYRGDVVEAEHFLSMLDDVVATQGLVIWSGLAECLRSMLLITKGDRAGVHSLQRKLEDLRAAHIGHRYAAYLGILALGLGGIGERAGAFNTIEIALDWSKRHEDLWCLAELLRIKGWLLHLDRLPASNRAAEIYLMQALDVARCQNTLTWELRAAIDLAKIWRSEGRSTEARQLLLPIYERFTEGFDTADLRAARAVLRGPGGGKLGSPPVHRKRRASLQDFVTP